MCVEVKDENYAYIARITKLCICVCERQRENRQQNKNSG